MAELLKSLKLIADPTRLRILSLLENEALTVAELQEILGMAQSRTSAQLSQLKEGGLVQDQKSGKNSIYSICAAEDLLKLVREAVIELPEVAADRRTLHHILRKRRDKARAYFDELAGKFGKHYVPGRSWKALAEALIKILNYEQVADLGAGEGTLSQLLARRAQKVIAVDNSEEMVKFGKGLAKEHDLPNLEYRLGEIEDPPIKEGTMDLVLFSQALHHAQRPEKALAAAYRILKPGGVVVVLDLLQHSFEKARELYFDVWLGFPEAGLGGMLEDAGFEEIETVIVDKESQAPHFQTLLGTGKKGK